MLGSRASLEQSSSGTSRGCTGGTGAGSPPIPCASKPAWRCNNSFRVLALVREMLAAPAAGAMPGADPALLPVLQVQ